MSFQILYRKWQVATSDASIELQRCMIQPVVLLILEVKQTLKMSVIVLDRSINTRNMFIRQVLGVLVRLTEQQAYS